MCNYNIKKIVLILISGVLIAVNYQLFFPKYYRTDYVINLNKKEFFERTYYPYINNIAKLILKKINIYELKECKRSGYLDFGYKIKAQDDNILLSAITADLIHENKCTNAFIREIEKNIYLLKIKNKELAGENKIYSDLIKIISIRVIKQSTEVIKIPLTLAITTSYMFLILLTMLLNDLNLRSCKWKG